jgi:hypothetical protein
MKCTSQDVRKLTFELESYPYTFIHGSMHYIIIGKQLPGSYQFKLNSVFADETLWSSLSMDENISFI